MSDWTRTLPERETPIVIVVEHFAATRRRLQLWLSWRSPSLLCHLCCVTCVRCPRSTVGRRTRSHHASHFTISVCRQLSRAANVSKRKAVLEGVVKHSNVFVYLNEQLSKSSKTPTAKNQRRISEMIFWMNFLLFVCVHERWQFCILYHQKHSVRLLDHI